MNQINRKNKTSYTKSQREKHLEINFITRADKISNNLTFCQHWQRKRLRTTFFYKNLTQFVLLPLCWYIKSIFFIKREESKYYQLLYYIIILLLYYYIIIILLLLYYYYIILLLYYYIIILYYYYYIIIILYYEVF